jgi:plasmid stabilization system protein ParE
MPPFRVERVSSVGRDLRAILAFLTRSYMQFGEGFSDGKAQAARRVMKIEEAMEALGLLPHQGTLRPRLMPGLRSVTKDRAVFYFTVDDEARVVRVLTVFFGGQDHQREMLKRLRG